MTTGTDSTVGTAAAEPMDGKGNDPYPEGLYLSLDGEGNETFPPSLFESLDGKGNDVYPQPGVYGSHQSGVMDGTGDDAMTYPFPIDNATIAVTYAGRGGGSGKPSY